MNIETFIDYLNMYGYIIIFIFLFFGIVGIPAPEESLLFLIGVSIDQHSLAIVPAGLSAFFGAFSGMFSAYAVGKFIGSPFIHKYGRYVGITEERWDRVINKYRKNARKTIIFGFYMPGIRQISPYFAGMNKIPFLDFLLTSLLGTVLWIFPFILIGYYTSFMYPWKVRKGVEDTANIIENITGVRPIFYRPPWGMLNFFDFIKRGKYLIILWSIMAEDWRTSGGSEKIKHRLSSIKGGDIILLHDCGDSPGAEMDAPRNTINALKDVLKTVKTKGFTCVRIDELINKELLISKGYRLGNVDLQR